MRVSVPLLLALLSATPAAAHLAHRGTPLSELAVSSPVVVVARVEAAAGERVTVEVEETVLGEVPPGPLSFRHQSHHAPIYAPGVRVLLFLSSATPPWSSRQAAPDALEMPSDPAERSALLSAVRHFAGLRALPGTAQRLAALKALSLQHLASPSPRLRREALYDLIAIAGRTPFGDEEIEVLARLAGSGDTPETLGPGLVVLLATIRTPSADRALFDVLASQGGGQARARAAQVIANRHGARAADTLRGVLDDPAPAVRATARHALARIDPVPSTESHPSQ